MLKKNQKGFGAVEILILVVVITVASFGGWYVAKHKTNPVTNSTQAKTTPASTSSYLVIKEWGVKITLSGPISNATYQIVTNNKYLNPSAFLSTATLDASTDCTSYYTTDATPDDPLPTFQWIERFALTDTTPSDEQTTITAQQAVQQKPNAYKQIGNYVYYFDHGNGMPCQEQISASAQGGASVAAFATAFATITQAQ